MRDLTLNSDWQGPIKSAYGWHTTQLYKRKFYVPPYSEVRQQVASDAFLALGDSATDAYYEDLRQKYEVNYPPSLVPFN